jgi:hypothetical protein
MAKVAGTRSSGLATAGLPEARSGIVFPTRGIVGKIGQLSSEVAMKPAGSRRRMSVLLLGVVAFLGAAWLLVREPRRDAEYYFPTWHSGSVEYSEVERRQSELTNVVEALPVVLAALERKPSPVGELWRKGRDHGPQFLSDALPAYVGPTDGYHQAMMWLGRHATNAHVWAAVRLQSARWPEQTLADWFGAANPVEMARLGDYPEVMLPPLRQSRHALLVSVAFVHFCFWPEPNPEVEDALAEVLRGSLVAGHANIREQLCGKLRSGKSLSPPVVQALREWRNSPHPAIRLEGAFTLCAVDPEQFRPEDLLEPEFRVLPEESRWRYLAKLGARSGERLAGSAWALRQCEVRLDALQAAPPGEMLHPGDIGGVLPALANAGLNAKEFGPKLLTLLSATATDESHARGAAKALAAITPADAAWSPQFQPWLTNAATCGAFLLWHASLGEQAAPAVAQIRALAEDRTYVTEASIRVVSAVLSRYGFSSERPIGRAVKEQLHFTGKSPRQVRMELRDCPPRLRKYWPGYVDSPEQLPPWEEAVRLSRYAPVNLADLARHALTFIAPTNAPAGP